jgi:Host cell surface-exposed lipoprotein
VSLVCLVAFVAGCGSNTTTTAKQAAATPPPEPSVELHLNQGSFSQTSSQTTLTGTVTPGAAVTVNEHPTAVHGGDWHGTVQHLHVGGNTIVVSASLTGHQSAEDTITVTRHHTQAELEAIAQARKEREARRKEREEQREHEERAHKEVEERKEREHQEVEDASASQQNALQSAESYLETSAFSEAGLIEQLSSEAGSKFTMAQAEYAANKVGLC